MKTTTLSQAVLLIAFCATVACKKSADGGGGGTPPPPPNTDTVGTLKDAADFPIGIGIDYSPMKNNVNYANVVKREFDNVTFAYEMKHGAIVKDYGVPDYSRADEIYNIVNTAGMTVYGHTLCWHQNNNGNYLRSLLTGGGTGPTLILNGGFEGGTGNTFTNWFTQVSGGGVATFTAETAAADVNEGTRALKVAVTGAATSAFNIQAVNDAWTAVSGHQYKITFFAKATAGSGTFKVVAQGTTYYAERIITPTANWTMYEFNVTPTETAPQVKFHFGANTGTYSIDNISVIDLSVLPPPTADEIKARVDTALKRFITGMADRYKNKLTGWDVVNEVMADGNSGLRTNPTPGVTTGQTFYWVEYLGRDFIKKAFQYAIAADPNAVLFINDYNLESNSAKLDSTINLINQLKAQGIPIHGFGTQMHANVNTTNAGIDQMFQKMAATGLKVKVTEIDVRVNPGNTAGFALTPDLLNKQAAVFKYTIESYIRNVPAAQRAGFTVWNLTDQDSWIVTGTVVDFPTMFNASFTKKPAFYSTLLGLKGK
jgi:endo-1,4-beta-xylanase